MNARRVQSVTLAVLQRVLEARLFAIGDANARNDMLLLEYPRRQRTCDLQRTI
jgi:hypothetical protein